MNYTWVYSRHEHLQTSVAQQTWNLYFFSTQKNKYIKKSTFYNILYKWPE